MDRKVSSKAMGLLNAMYKITCAPGAVLLLEFLPQP
jgi:hypothetical protein